MIHDDKSALRLLEAMLRDCSEDFEGGVVAYLDAEKRERLARNRLKRCLSDFVNARNAKYIALQRFAPEYSFLMGKETVKPVVEGEWVVKHLIEQIIDSLDDARYAEIADVILSDENGGNDSIEQ